MTSDDLVVLVFDTLSNLGVPFMASGSLASNFYGVPRATQDADLVLDLARLDISAFAAALEHAFDVDRQVGFETVTGSSRLVLRGREWPFDVELFGLTSDEHDVTRFSRRRVVHVLGRTVALPSAEDVVITKLRWFTLARRRKDFEDARNVLAVQRSALDWVYLRQWCHALDLDDVLRDANAV